MKLRKFVDPLPVMDTIKPKKQGRKGSYYEVGMREFKQKLHRDLPPTTLWGYESQFPGPTFEVTQGEATHVKWLNHLPDRHILPVDTSIHSLASQPIVRTVTHLHGSVTKPDSDGYPEAWFTRNFQQTGPVFTRKVYEYPNNQRATTLWYHDHAMGITRLNVYAGLVGAYIIRDKKEKNLKLPSGNYEIPLILLDRSFHSNGSLKYPNQPEDASSELPNPSIVPAYLGETILVNGKVWPYLEVEPRKYRFRLINASNTRTYQMYLDNDHPFLQIGSDGGLLRAPLELRRLTLEPAERADIIIDFSTLNEEMIRLKNDLGEDADPEDETHDVMQFRVNKPLRSNDTSRVPNTLSNIPSLKSNRIQAIRKLKLLGSEDEFGRPLLLLDNKMWHDPVTETPRLNTTEVWEFMNVTNFTHPIHLHLVQFQVIDRQPFDLEQYNADGSMVYTEPASPPQPNERGWKDTIAAPSGQLTRVIAKFSPYTGDYVWHCHILEHEDYDMMRPFRVVTEEEDIDTE
ncbi:multicopper oxidase family protein [Oceanobacillus kapialis]|uniref:multicopper oxidase family protein n=1 Tax=Oceanobacillus kapialis TaxID=481353 RepID=UPI00384BF0C2